MRLRRVRILDGRRMVSEPELLTDELLSRIIHSKDLETFLGPSVSARRDLAGFLNRMLAEKGLKKSEVIRAAQLNETFGYQIFAGQRNPSRNKVLALVFALGLDLKEARQALAHADVGDLFFKNRRDAIISFCISHHYNLNAADAELYRFGEETICDAE